MKKLFLPATLAFAIVAPAFAGTQFTATTTVEGSAGVRGPVTKVKGVADGERARVDIVESGEPTLIPGDWLLSTDGGKTVKLIKPKTSSYGRWDGETADRYGSGPVHVGRASYNATFSTPQVEKLETQTGEPLLGLKTKHTKLRITFTKGTKLSKSTRSTKITVDAEMWSAVDVPDSGVSTWLTKPVVRTGVEEVDGVLSGVFGAIEGYPLKSILTTTTTDSKGSTTATRVVREVTSFGSAEVPQESFVLPEGFKEVAVRGPATDDDRGYVLPRPGAAGAESRDPGGAPPPGGQKRFESQEVSRPAPTAPAPSATPGQAPAATPPALESSPDR